MASFTRVSLIVLMVAMLTALTTVSYAVTIETVPVGNPGNASDVAWYSPPGGSQQGWSTPPGAVAYNYRIAKYEVSNTQYVEFLDAVAKTDAYGLYNTNNTEITQAGGSGSYTYSVGAGDALLPVGWVSWGDAARFANWLHNGQPTTGVQDNSTTEDGAYELFGATTDAELLAVNGNRQSDWRWALPSLDENQKAAHYDPGNANENGYWKYGTQSDIQPANTSGGTLQDTVVYDGSNTARADVNNSGGLSYYGTMGQTGNTGEWLETRADDWQTSGSREDNYHLTPGSYNWGWTIHKMHASAEPPTHEVGDYYGFRVTQVPEPGTLTLLGCGLLGLALVAWRKRRSG